MIRWIILFFSVFLSSYTFGQLSYEARLKLIKELNAIPTFVGCEGLQSRSERKACTIDSVRSFILKNTNQHIVSDPEAEKDDVFVRFTVDTLGVLKDFRLALPSKTNNPKLHAEALRVIQGLPRMLPAEVNGEKMEVNMVEVVLFEGKEILQPVIEESLPVWPSCLDEITERDQENCTTNKMRKYLNEKAKELFPSDLRVSRLKATARCNFYINEKGLSEEISIISSTNHDELDALAIEIVKSMPAMQPGTKDEKPIRVEYNMSLSFK